MQNPATKLAVLAGVIGIVLLALLQAHRGMKNGASPQEEVAAPAPQVQLGGAGPLSGSSNPEDLPAPDGQFEPDPGDYEIIRPRASALSDAQVQALPIGSRNDAPSSAPRVAATPEESAEYTVQGGTSRVPVRPVSHSEEQNAPGDDGLSSDPFAPQPAAPPALDEFDSAPPPSSAAPTPAPNRRPPAPIPAAPGPLAEPPLAPGAASPAPRRLSEPDDLDDALRSPAPAPAGYGEAGRRRSSAAPAGVPLPSENEEAPAAPPVREATGAPAPRDDRGNGTELDLPDSFDPVGAREPRPRPLADDEDGDDSDANPAPPPGPSRGTDSVPVRSAPVDAAAEPAAPQPRGEAAPPPFSPYEDFDSPPAESRAAPPPSDTLPEPELTPPASPLRRETPLAEPAPLRSLPLVPVPEAETPATDASEPSAAPPQTEPFPSDSSAEPQRLRGLADPSAAPAGAESEPPSARFTDPPASPPAPETPGELLGDATLDEDAPSGPQRPQIVLEKIAPETAVLGQSLIYSIVVRNTGDSPASEVVVEDRIPAGTKLTGTIPRAELHDKKLIWQLGTLDPGAEKKISVRVIPLTEGEIGSVATVNFVAEVAARTRITTPRLKIALEGPQQARAGEPVVFHFRVTNEGAAPARNVVLRDLIPDGLSHSAGNDLEYAVGDLAAGETKQVQLTLTAARPGRTVNRAVVTADGNLSAESSAAVEVLAPPLAIARTGPARHFVGREAIFTNAVTNQSDQPIEGATVTEIVPTGCEFVEASHNGRFDPAGRTVVWNIDRLDPNESVVLKVKLRPTGTGGLESVVQATDSNGLRSQAVSRTAVVGFAALGLDVSAERAPALVGDELPLTVRVQNDGTAEATHVGVTLDVPQELELVAARGPTKYRQEGGRVVFDPIPELESGTPATIQAVFRAARPGDARIRVSIEADQMQRPLVREEAALVIAADP